MLDSAENIQKTSFQWSDKTLSVLKAIIYVFMLRLFIIKLSSVSKKFSSIVYLVPSFSRVPK